MPCKGLQLVMYFWNRYEVKLLVHLPQSVSLLCRGCVRPFLPFNCTENLKNDSLTEVLAFFWDLELAVEVCPQWEDLCT